MSQKINIKIWNDANRTSQHNIRGKNTLQHKKKQIAQPERQKNRWSDTEKNLQKTKSVKVSILVTKMNEAMRKTVSKNKASRELHIKNQKAQKQETNAQIIVHNAYQNTVQIANKQSKKKMHH